MYTPGASTGSPSSLPVTLIAVGEPRPLPAPLPAGDGPVSVPGSRPLIETVLGTAGDDQLLLPAGGFANGLGGNDTFILQSSGKAQSGLEQLGLILDFNEGDELDLSKLGEKAAIVSREAGPVPGAPERVTIDYDGDGTEDGFVLLSSSRTPDFGDVRPMPMPTPIDDGQFHILPFPMPDDGVVSSPVPDGVVRILPYPMPGDGPFTISSAPGAEPTAFASPGEADPISEAVFTILPYAGEGMAGAIGLAAHAFVFSDPAYSAEWIG